VLEDFQEKRPRHRIECAHNVNFEKEGGLPSCVQQLGNGLNKFKIILYEPTFDEGTLTSMHEILKPMGQSVGQDLQEELPEYMN
jgi:hypothetical protein